MRIPSGVVDQYIYFVAVDDAVGTRKTGLSSFTVYRSRDGGAAAAFTTPTINETSSANMPGVYELLLDEDMTIGAGNLSEEMVFHITATGMLPVTRTIELYDSSSTAPTAADIRAEIDSNSTQLAAIAADTNELQTDWVNGGRLDLILDARSSQTSVDDLPTNAELATALGTADDATLAAIAALETHGDSTWATATGFSTHAAADVWSVATRVLTAGTNIQLPANGLANVTAWTVDITGDITGNLSGSVGSVSGLTASDVSAIKTKTDSLTYTVAGKVDANIEYVNGTEVTGSGTSGDPWGP